MRKAVKNTFFYMGMVVGLTMIVSCTSKQTPIHESQLFSSEVSNKSEPEYVRENQQKIISAEEIAISSHEAASILFEYIYPGSDYFSSAEYEGNDTYGEYKFSLSNDEMSHLRRIVYCGMTGNYYRFEFYTDNFSHDFEGNYEYTNSNYYSGFAVHQVTKEILQERHDDGCGIWAYSEKYLALLKQAESGSEVTAIIVSEDEYGHTLLTGKGSNGADFSITLEYSKEDVVVNDSYYVDLTEDGTAEICIELNIQNTVSPDMNIILVYDVKNQKLLFPNNKKPFIYNGEVARVDIEQVILYQNLEKINGLGIQSEYSAMQWNGSEFVTIRYYKKLLAQTTEYVLFYDSIDEFSEAHTYKLVVLDPESLEITQEIKILPEKEADIVGNINQGLLAVTDNTTGQRNLDLYIEGYGILHWNNETKLFDTVPRLATSEEITKLYYCDRLNPNFSPGESDYMTFDTYVCYPKYKGDREKFVKDYLETRGMYKKKPDGINERDGKRCSEYYVNEDKISFIIYKSWYENMVDDVGNPYPDCIYCFTVTRDELQLQGYLASVNEANKGPAYQRLYGTEGELEAYVSYEYDSTVPFPIITDHKEYVDYSPIWVNNVYYFIFCKDDMIFDETGRWSGYSSCLLGGGEGNHHNICDYNAQGKLETIREPLLDQDKIEHYYKDYSGEILLSYNEGGSPVSLDYWYSNGTHRIGSGISGEFMYDDKGRIISWSFISGDVFLIYDGNDRTPWARISIGGNPYSGDGVEEGITYGHNANVYLYLSGE